MVKKYLKPLLLLLWMGVIFYMSAQPSIESQETSNLVAKIIFDFLNIFSSGMLNESEFMLKYIQPIRKLAHFSEFAILGVLALLTFRQYDKKRALSIAIVFCLLYAISDEIHQLFVPNRYCDIHDVMIDFLGSFTGIILCHLVQTGWKKHHS